MITFIAAEISTLYSVSKPYSTFFVKPKIDHFTFARNFHFIEPRTSFFRKYLIFDE